MTPPAFGTVSNRFVLESRMVSQSTLHSNKITPIQNFASKFLSLSNLTWIKFKVTAHDLSSITDWSSAKQALPLAPNL
jgi:hypothetical protein